MSFVSRKHCTAVAAPATAFSSFVSLCGDLLSGSSNKVNDPNTACSLYCLLYSLLGD